MRKLLVSLLSIMMVVALATPVFATGEGTGTSEDPVRTPEQLNTALKSEASEIYVSGEIKIGSLTLNRGVSIKAADNTAKLVGSIVLSASNKEDYTFDGLTFDGNGSYVITLEADSSTQVGTVIINQCTFTNAKSAVMFATDKGQSVNSLSVTESNLKDLTFNAIYVEDLSSVSVKGSNFTDCGKGILPFTHKNNEVGNISITGNKFTGTEVAVKFEVEKDAIVDDNTKIEITNNTGDGNGKIDYVVDNTVSSELINKVEISGNDMPLVGAPVASVDDKTYDSLGEALKEATSGKTVKLLSDVEVDEMLNISDSTTSGDNFIIDLNGHKITSSASYTGSGNNGHVINVTGKTVTIKGDGTANSAIVGKNNNRHVILADSNANLTLEDLTVDHSQCAAGAPLVVSESNVVLKGTVNFKLNAQSWYAVNVDSDETKATLEVAEGTVVNSDGSENQPVVVSEGPYKDGSFTGGSAKVTFNGKVYAEGPALCVQDENGTAIKLSDVNKDDYVVLGPNTNVKINTETGVADGEVEPTPTPTPDPTPEKPTYRPSSPSKDLPSNTKECQKEFGDEYIWSDEYDACVIKFMIVDTSTK